jgi:hypothetical protein
LSALVAHTAWHWMIDRGTVLRQFRFTWPVWNAALMASWMRWLMLIVLAAGLVWGVMLVLRRRVVRHKSISRVSAP